MNHGHRRIVAAAGLIVFAGSIVGCTASQMPVRSDEAQAWLDELDVDEEGSVAVFSGAPSLDFDSGDTIGVGYDPVAQVTSAEFSCFGEESMSVELWVEGSASATTLREEDLICEASPHTIEIAMDGVDAVRSNAVSPDGTGAWAVVFRGSID